MTKLLTNENEFQYPFDILHLDTDSDKNRVKWIN